MEESFWIEDLEELHRRVEDGEGDVVQRVLQALGETQVEEIKKSHSEVSVVTGKPVGL